MPWNNQTPLTEHRAKSAEHRIETFHMSMSKTKLLFAIICNNFSNLSNFIYIQQTSSSEWSFISYICLYIWTHMYIYIYNLQQPQQHHVKHHTLIYYIIIYYIIYIYRRERYLTSDWRIGSGIFFNHEQSTNYFIYAYVFVFVCVLVSVCILVCADIS